MRDDFRKMINDAKDIQNGVYDLKKENERLESDNSFLRKQNALLIDACDDKRKQNEKLQKESDANIKLLVSKNELLEKKVEDYNRSFDVLAQRNIKMAEANKQFRETNFKLLGRVSKYTEQLEKYEQALYRICSDESVTWEQTEVIAKRALGLSPFDKGK